MFEAGFLFLRGKMFQKSLLFIYLLLILSLHSTAQTVQNSDTVLVLPFENISGKTEFNWVGESFAASLVDLLKVPSLKVVDNAERKIIQQRLRVPLSALPSLATSLKLAREGKASILIAGKYDITPAEGDVAARLNVTAQIIRVNEGRYLNEEFPDGRRITRDINLIDALAELQTIEGQLAYQVLYQRDKNLAFSQKYFVDLSNKVPAKAFEAYIKGLLTSDRDLQTREAYFKNAMIQYADAKAAAGADESNRIYADAALELGHLYLNQKKAQNAIEYFSQVPEKDSHYAEAAFYIGLIYWQQKNYEQALAVLTPLADDLKLTSVYNTLGAIAVAASSAEKKDKGRSSARLTQGIEFLKKAAESDPEDPESNFNYGVALFLNNNYAASANQMRPVIAQNPRDGEAYYILAKALESRGETSNAAEFDNQARRFLSNYAKLETDWQRAKSIETIPLRVEQPPRKDFVSVILISKQNTPIVRDAVDEADLLLDQARNAYKNGKDDDVMQITRRIVSGDPMNAESHLLQGKVYLRRGELDQSISSLKTALFWDNRLIEAHINLAKIFIEKKDCQQAQNYAVSAITLDENNPEAIALQRQIERCSK